MDWTAVRRLYFLRILVSDAAVRAAETAAVGQRDDHEVTAAGERVKSITKNPGCQAKALDTLLTLISMRQGACGNRITLQAPSDDRRIFRRTDTSSCGLCRDAVPSRRLSWSVHSVFHIRGIRNSRCLLDFHADKARWQKQPRAECQ